MNEIDGWEKRAKEKSLLGVGGLVYCIFLLRERSPLVYEQAGIWSSDTGVFWRTVV